MGKIVDFTKKYPKLSWFLGVVGTIVIGGLGSGVWEYILKPLILMGTNTILDVTTLGLETYKNAIYIEIAKGFTDSNAVSSVTRVGLLIAYIFLIFYVILKAILHKQRKQFVVSDEKIRILDLEIIKKKLKVAGILIKIFLFLIFILFTLEFSNSFKSMYINDAITYYEQLRKIALPYTDDNNIKKIDSKFALIKNKKDYISVISELEEVLKKEKIEIERINVW